MKITFGIYITLLISSALTLTLKHNHQSAFIPIDFHTQSTTISNWSPNNTTGVSWAPTSSSQSVTNTTQLQSINSSNTFTNSSSNLPSNSTNNTSSSASANTTNSNITTPSVPNVPVSPSSSNNTSILPSLPVKLLSPQDLPAALKQKFNSWKSNIAPFTDFVDGKDRTSQLSVLLNEHIGKKVKQMLGQ